MNPELTMVLLTLSCPRAVEHDLMDALRELLQGDEYVEISHLEWAGLRVQLATPVEYVAARARASRLQMVLPAERAQTLLHGLRGRFDARIDSRLQQLDDSGEL